MCCNNLPLFQVGCIGRLLDYSWSDTMTTASAFSVLASRLDPGTITSIGATSLSLRNTPIGLHDVHAVAHSFETIGVPRVIHLVSAFDIDSSLDYENQSPVYLICLAGLHYRGSWSDVVDCVTTDAWTSTQVIPVEDLEGDRRPEPVAATRVRQLKDESGLTWDQVSRLFGVSRRSVHLWASGARMNARHDELLSYLEQVIDTFGSADPDRNRATLMNPSAGGGRSLFQQLVMRANPIERSEIDARTESTGAGSTIHGEFLFADTPGSEKGIR